MMSWNDLRQTAIDLLVCPYCGASPGQRCTTSSGAPAHPSAHWLRIKPLSDAWSGGYQFGNNDLLDNAIDSPNWFARTVERRRQERAS